LCPTILSNNNNNNNTRQRYEYECYMILNDILFLDLNKNLSMDVNSIPFIDFFVVFMYLIRLYNTFALAFVNFDIALSVKVFPLQICKRFTQRIMHWYSIFILPVPLLCLLHIWNRITNPYSYNRQELLFFCGNKLYSHKNRKDNTRYV